MLALKCKLALATGQHICYLCAAEYQLTINIYLEAVFN